MTQRETTPFPDQKPGTSGLRKRVKVFSQPNYVENFIQATLDAIPSKISLVVGGDGRFFSKQAIEKIISVCAGNGVKKLYIGKDGILSTPAVSNLIRKFKTSGGIILTASHNPGGEDGDFGIKFNMSNGGPAIESITDKIYEISKNIKSFRVFEGNPINLSTIGSFSYGNMEIEIVDSVKDYVDLLKSIFDFTAIKEFIKSRNFSLLFDGMHGVTGPYARQIFVNELGLNSSSVMNDIPLPDFGGGHPDPNLTYAKELVDLVKSKKIEFGAASDGDGDRNMIISFDSFVNPSDSVAVIADNAEIAIPYFKEGIKGLARSMPTSCAIDRVAIKKGYPLYEVPTGWKFFGNLMDANNLSICGEESFGTGSDHIREKDGIWAVVAWLSILAHHYNSNYKDISVSNILQAHYKKYGRNFFTRYDYEDLSTSSALLAIKNIKSAVLALNEKRKFGESGEIFKCDDFSYVDPIDGSLTTNQGFRIIFSDTSRIIFRLSGTGSSGSTIRLYVEKYTNNSETFANDAQDVLRELVNCALELSDMKNSTGREEPTVIT
jgi:phosphoglucomutase